jgi:hypothetical protein
MFIIDIVDQTDENILKDFPEFVGADGAVVALFFDGTPVGAAQVVFERGIDLNEIMSENGAEKDSEIVKFESGLESGLNEIQSDFSKKEPKELRRVKKMSLKKGFDALDIRRFFIRSLVFKLLDGNKWIYSDFKDALLEEIGFLPFGDGLRCRSDSVVFKKMCGDS